MRVDLARLSLHKIRAPLRVQFDLGSCAMRQLLLGRHRFKWNYHTPVPFWVKILWRVRASKHVRTHGPSGNINMVLCESLSVSYMHVSDRVIRALARDASSSGQAVPAQDSSAA